MRLFTSEAFQLSIAEKFAMIGFELKTFQYRGLDANPTLSRNIYAWKSEQLKQMFNLIEPNSND